MSLFSLNSFLGIFQIIVQAVAAVYAYKIYSFNRLNKGWIAMIFALILMTLRRVTALLIEVNYLPTLTGIISYIDRVILPALISLLLLIGLYVMFRNFETFEIVEKTVKRIVGRKK